MNKLEALLTYTPVMVPLAKDEPLLLYVAATTQVVSAAIVVKRQEEGHVLPVMQYMKYDMPYVMMLHDYAL